MSTRRKRKLRKQEKRASKITYIPVVTYKRKLLLIAILVIMLASSAFFLYLSHLENLIPEFSVKPLFYTSFIQNTHGSSASKKDGWSKDSPYWIYSVNKMYKVSNPQTEELPDPLQYPDDILATGNTSWGDYTLTTRIQHADTTALGLVFRYTDGQNFYKFLQYEDASTQKVQNVLVKELNGQSIVLARQTQSEGDTFTTQWKTIEIVAHKNSIMVYVDSKQILSTTDNSFSHGQIGLFAWPRSSGSFQYLKAIAI